MVSAPTGTEMDGDTEFLGNVLGVVYEEGMAKQRTYQVTIPVQIEGRPVDELVLNVPASSYDEVKPILNKALKKLLETHLETDDDLAEVDHYEFDSDLALTPEEQIATVKWVGKRRRDRMLAERIFKKFEVQTQVIDVLKAQPFGYTPTELQEKLKERGVREGDVRDAVCQLWDDGAVQMGTDRRVTLTKG